MGCPGLGPGPDSAPGDEIGASSASLRSRDRVSIIVTNEVTLGYSYDEFGIWGRQDFSCGGGLVSSA
jgi:hypothetical protein